MKSNRIGVVLSAAALLALALIVPSTVRAQAPVQPTQPAKPEAVTRLEQVTLFKHGLAHFTWSAVLTGDGNIDLEFTPGEMNDVLKSLTVVDLDGGTIASVDYDSKVPIDKELRETNITLSREDTLVKLLTSLQGAEIAAQIGSGEPARGRIMGLQVRDTVIPGQNPTTVREPFIVLQDATGAIVQHSLYHLTSIRFVNPDLQQQVGRILEVLFATKEKEKKRVRIQAQGEGVRKVMVAYTVPAPVWKTSYRFILEDEEKPFLQGWALVDNTTAHDWDGVTLTLAAGLPISFIHDLYSPLYRERPVVAVDRGPVAELPRAEMARKARVQSRARNAEKSLAFDAGEDELYEPDGAPMAPAGSAGGYLGGESLAQALEQSVNVQVAAEAAGDLFHYRIEHPVSIERNRSSLVPVLQTRLDGKKVLMVDREVRSDRAMNAVFVTNTSGLTLEGGPFTVFDGEAYAGEGMLPLLKPAVDALIPYAVELGAEVRSNYNSVRKDSHQITVDQGAIWMRGYTDWSTEYVISNKTGHAATVYLRHPRRAGAELTSEAKPEKTEETHYRFAFDIAAGEEKTFPVVERELRQERLEIGNLAPEQLRTISQSGVVTAPVRAFLEEVATLQANRTQLNQARLEAEREIQKIASDHGRIRENLNALRNSADEERLRQRYLGRLMADEDRIEKLRQEIQELLAEIKSLDGRISEKIRGFRSL